MFEQIHSWDNLLLAFRRAAKGKRGRPNVAAFELRLEENLLGLQERLRAQAYRPGCYVSFHIHDPKRRLISAAPFADRVVHHALCNVTEPLFERRFVEECFANRVGYGTHRALDHCQRLARQYRFVLQCDVRQYFPAIDHGILRQQMGQVMADEGVLWLVDCILAGGRDVLAGEYDMTWFAGDDLSAAWRSRGLPIGNLTSQLWANAYLSPFDHFVKRELRCRGYVRYVDDILLFHDDKRMLWRWREAIMRRLARYRLRIHNGSHPRPVTEGIPFLGFVVYPDRRRVKRRNAVNFARRFRRLVERYRDGEAELADVTASVQGWANHARYANTVGLRKALLSRVKIGPPESVGS